MALNGKHLELFFCSLGGRVLAQGAMNQGGCGKGEQVTAGGEGMTEPVSNFHIVGWSNSPGVRARRSGTSCSPVQP